MKQLKGPKRNLNNWKKLGKRARNIKLNAKEKAKELKLTIQRKLELIETISSPQKGFSGTFIDTFITHASQLATLVVAARTLEQTQAFFTFTLLT